MLRDNSFNFVKSQGIFKYENLLTSLMSKQKVMSIHYFITQSNDAKS